MLQKSISIVIVVLVCVYISLGLNIVDDVAETDVFGIAHVLPYATMGDSEECLTQAAKTISGIPTTYSDCSRAVVKRYLMNAEVDLYE